MRSVLAVLGCALLAPAFSRAAVDFQSGVQPILARSCLGCHAAGTASGGLRLDSRAAALAVLSPGNAAGSRLLARIAGTGPGPRMPLTGAPLTAEQVATLKQWIEEGAPWPEGGGARKHWAYVKPVRPALPAVQAAGWVRNPIDSFVLARLEKDELKPSPEASRETLLRRVTLDLTGLPPTIAEIDAFLADSNPRAYEQVVERLLASPRFGERWARPWLDMARYADTNGYEKDRRRSMWKYRDWVIGALNADLPFDRFTIEQLAGDMLPGATTEQKIASGFHRNSMYNEEGGVDKDEAFWENLVDRTATTATVWMGSTLGCAQCHNHKFDPFTQKEFYQMMAFFNNGEKEARNNGDTSQTWVEPQLMLPTSGQQEERNRLERAIHALEEKIKAADLGAEQAEWERSVRGATTAWRTLTPLSAVSQGGSILTVARDGSVLASGPNPRAETFTIEAAAGTGKITGIRLEALPDPTLPRGGPGRDIYGNVYLTEIQIAGAALREAAADDGSVKFNKPGEQLWVVDASRDERRLPRQLILLPAKPIEAGAGQPLRISIRQQSDFNGQGLGRFRLSYTTSENPKAIIGVGAKLRPILEKKDRTEAEGKQLADFYRDRAASLSGARDELKERRKQLADLGIVSTLVLQEARTFERPTTFLRIGGQYLSKGDPVYAGTPAALPPMPESELPNRLGLARWLTSRENPLTARVAVNRMWEQYFGRGIVETSEDFGSQGERPTHPELLDWLAVEFMDRGWSAKAIHRLIVTSSTYRQSSQASPELLEKDPSNKLLARGPRFRMEAEMIRDVALASSGLLSSKMFGPSVFPPQPEGVWDIPYSDDKWTESKGEDKYRRALYTFMRRTAPYPSLLTFDATSREYCTVRRIRTNTPLQALTTLNDPAFFEAAQALAGRAAQSGVSYAFRLCTGRTPKAAEADRLQTALAKERVYFAAHPEEARKVAPKDPALAPYTMLANALLNLDETLTKE